MQNTERKYGLAAGFSILIMAIAAGFAHGYADAEIFTGSSQETLQNLLAHRMLYHWSVAAWTVIFITDLIVTWTLYIVFLNTSKKASLATAILRFVYSLVLGLAVVQLFRISGLLNHVAGANDLISAETIHARFELFNALWSAGLIVFGFHLLGLGYLSVKSAFVPRIFGFLLYLAGISYVVVHGARQLRFVGQANVDALEQILILPMMLGEMLLAFWLIYKGLKRYRTTVEVKMS